MADGQVLKGEVTLDALKSKTALATDANGVIVEVSGASGSFTSSDGKTVTVTKGIITSIV